MSKRRGKVQFEVEPFRGENGIKLALIGLCPKPRSGCSLTGFLRRRKSGSGVRHFLLCKKPGKPLIFLTALAWGPNFPKPGPKNELSDNAALS